MTASPALQSFDRIWESRGARQAHDPSPMQALRGEAWALFNRLGIPTLRDESWHYTNLRLLAARSFAEPAAGVPAAGVPAAGAPAAGNRAAAITDSAGSWLPPGAACARIKLFNGIPMLPGDGRVAEGIEVDSLRRIESADPGALTSLMLPLSAAEHRRWMLLNTALFEDGLHLRISAGGCPALLIEHVAAAEGAQTIINPRVVVEASPGSSAVIIEHHVSGNPHGVFSNSVCSINLNPGAHVEHFRIFSGNSLAAHVDHLQVRAGRGAQLRQHTVMLDGGLTRANLDVELAGPDSSVDAFSLLTGHDARNADCVNIVTHAAPHTRSRQTARVIASGRSRVVFNSKVIVNAGAQKADSHQSCRGLLLSPTAEIDTRPQLEINANDVKCAHGATTGRLDPDMLFYLLARGLDRSTAQNLLVFAFLADVLTGMSLPDVRKGVESRLIEQLPDPQLLRQFR